MRERKKIVPSEHDETNIVNYNNHTDLVISDVNAVGSKQCETMSAESVAVLHLTPRPPKTSPHFSDLNSNISAQKRILELDFDAKEPKQRTKPPDDYFDAKCIKLVSLKKLRTPGYSKCRKFIWMSVTILCASVCLWQVCDRVRYYLTYPTSYQILVTEQRTVRFPAITLCPYEVLPYNSKYEDDYYDDSGDEKRQMLKLKEVWEEFRIDKHIEVFVSCASSKASCKLDDEDVPIQVKNRTFFTYLGLCVVLEPDVVMEYRGVLTWLQIYLSDRYPVTDNGTKYAALYYIHDPGFTYRHDVYYQATDLHKDYHNEVQLTVKKYNYISTDTNPCDKQEAVMRCKHNCMDDLLEKTADCWLPFMKSSSLKACPTVNDSLETLIKAYQFYSSFNVSHCDCKKACNKVVYSSIKTLNKKNEYDDGILLEIQYASNILETIIEHASYTFPAMLSDIGGSLGFFLGFCIFTVLELLEWLLDNVMTTFKVYCGRF